MADFKNALTVNGDSVLTALTGYTKSQLNTSGAGGAVHFNNVTNKPTTLAGYGISDAQALDADLTAIAALGFTATAFLKKTAANTWALDTATYLTGNQTITLAGDVSGSGATSIAVTLDSTGVAAGTYRSVTVDAKGRVTAGTNPTTIAGYGLTNVVQPYDATLTALAGLAGTVGFLKQTSAGVFGIDANTYSLSSHNHSGTYITPTYTGNVAITGQALIDGNFIVRDSSANTRFDVNLDAANVIRLLARTYSAGAYQSIGVYCTFMSINDTHYFGTGVTLGLSLGVGVNTNANYRFYTRSITDTSANYIFVGQNAAGTENRFLVRSDNYYGILGTWTNMSDERMKQDIKPDYNALSYLLKTQPVTYRWKEEVARLGDAARVRHGFIAQRIQKIDELSDVVTDMPQPEGNSSMLGIDYTDLIGPIVGAVQELHRRIEALEKNYV